MSKQNLRKKGEFSPPREERLHSDVESAMDDWLSAGEEGERPVRICVLNVENLVSTISDLRRRVEVCEKNIIYALRKNRDGSQ